MLFDDDTMEQLEEYTTNTLCDFEKAASKFANERIKNDKLKKRYTELTKKAAQEILVEARTKAARATIARPIWVEAAISAGYLRYAHMDITSENVSRTATIKLKEKDFDKWIEKNTQKLVASTRTRTTSGSYVELELTERLEDMEALIPASGRTNPLIPASGRTNLPVKDLSKVLSKLGYACILYTIAHSIYTICEADNPIKETVQTAASLGLGIAGWRVSAVLGENIGALGGPGGVIIGAIIGGIAGGSIAAYGGEELVNKLYTAFFPSPATGTGPPPFDVIPVLYGQPSLGCIPVIGSPNVGHGISRRDKPHLQEQPVVGLPKLWPN